MHFRKATTLGLLPVCLLLTCLPAAGQVFSELFSRSETEEEEKWDWITLDTGETLKGELRVMYDEEVEFDSDHFGIITIDWDDIAEIRTSRPQQVRTNQRTSHVGKLVMEGDTVRLSLGEQSMELRRGEIVSIAAGQPKESNYWTVKGSAGANVRSGNVEQTDFNVRATVQRRTAVTRFYWDYSGNYSQSEDIEIANNHRTNSYFDYFFSKRFFVRGLSVEYYRDPFLNIAHRQTYSSSLGYTLIDRKKLTVDVTGGPSWQNVEYKNVEPGTPGSEESFGAIFSTTVDWEITGWMDFIGNYRAQWASADAGGLSTLADSTIEIEMTKNIDLNFSFIWERISDPVADDEGNVPQQDDFRLIFGLGFDI
ncbi:MAG: YdiY family protein [Puniceicoccaceae bacterium]